MAALEFQEDEDDTALVTEPAPPSPNGMTSTEATPSSLIKKHSATLLLKMKQIYKLSDTAVNSIIGDISLFLESSLQEFKQQIMRNGPSTRLDEKKW